MTEAGTLNDVFVVTVSDGAGGTVDQTLTIAIDGTNDAPVISLVTGDLAAAGLTETNAGLSVSDTLTVTDVDLSDTVASSATVAASGITTGLVSNNAALLAMLTLTPSSGLAADTGATSNLAWDFDSDTEYFDYLADTETLTLTYTITVADGNGGTDTQDVVITITGTAL
jgi:hypothetical protein